MNTGQRRFTGCLSSNTISCKGMERVIHGTVMRMDVQGGVVKCHGTIMNLYGSNIQLENHGTIMNNHGTLVGGGVVYRDKIVYRDRVIVAHDVKQEELDMLRKRIQALTAENSSLRCEVRRMECERAEYHSRKDAEELLEIAMDVNRRQAQRIKELEKGIADDWLRGQIDPWDIKPTKEQCRKLLEKFSSFLDSED